MFVKRGCDLHSFEGVLVLFRHCEIHAVTRENTNKYGFLFYRKKEPKIRKKTVKEVIHYLCLSSLQIPAFEKPAKGKMKVRISVILEIEKKREGFWLLPIIV